ncbi:MAG: sulfotransferase domain-containing protein [Bacteroidota bacterium]
MADRLIHIGFPKTGTTYLQSSIFPHLGVNYVDFRTSAAILNKLVYADPLDYNEVEIIEQLRDISKGVRTLFSFENLAGSPFYYKGLNRGLIPRSLKSLGFSKVIITIRNQQTAIESYYRQYVVQGGTLNFLEFLDLKDKRPWQSKFFNINYLKYDLILQKYVEVFGPENVLVLSQEMLRESRAAYVNKLCSFLGCEYMEPKELSTKSNRSLTDLSLLVLRLVNHFTYSAISPHHLISDNLSNVYFFKFLAVIFDPYFGRLFSGKKVLVEHYGLTSQIREIYRSSNEELNTKFGIDYR